MDGRSMPWLALVTLPLRDLQGGLGGRPWPSADIHLAEHGGDGGNQH
jgi:hypothetical protein